MGDRHSARATQALQRLSEADPAFASLALWCEHRDAAPEAADPAAWTDGRTIFYGPRFAALAPHEQVGLAAHQILHIAFRHAARSEGLRARRGDGFDAEIYNIATDAIVNQTLVLAGYALPRPCVMLAPLLEEAFAEIEPPERAIGAWDAERLYVRLSERSGSGSGRRPGAASEAAPAAASEAAARARAYALRCGFDRDLHGRDADADPTALAEDDGEWRQRVARALEAGRLAGRGIGALGHRLADLPRARTPWETLLRALVTRTLIDAPRASWRRPTRRWIALDSAARGRGAPPPPFEPGVTRRTEAARIAIGIDASGSVGDATLALFGAQIAGIGRRAQAEVHVFVFDDGVRLHKPMRGGAWEAEVAAMNFVRGGGTSYGDLFAAADRIDPSVIVVLTDLEAPTGGAPRAPVIWAVPGATPPRPPAFGRVVSLAD